MKKITTKLVASLLFVLGLVFGSLSISATFSSAPAFAIEGEEDTPTPEETAPVEGTVSDPTDAPATPQAPPEAQPDEDSATADDPNGPSDSDESEGDTPPEEDTPSGTPCSEQTGSLSWLICPLTDLISSAVDGIYSLINDFLVVNPISTESSSPIYIIWQYVRSITNFIFIIFLLIVILSQITGLGITNYGIKRVLPRLIIAVILVNLSFLICSLAVDLSNIIGNSLRGFFGDVQDTLLQSLNGSIDIQAISFSDLVGMLIGGGAIAGIAISLTGGLGALFWMLVPVLLGALVAVVTGLITIAGRQAVIALLIMISPLAFVAYLLPNTEKWFTSWKNLLIRMLVFYPLFSFLYGASQLTGWALIASAKNAFGVVLGLAVQVFPLFFSWSLMKMSGTILGTINDGLRKAVAPLQNVGSNWALEHSEMNRQLHIGQDEHSGARLRRYLDTRREMRLNAVRNATEIRHDRAIESAMTKSASITGRDEQGNTTWKKKPNKYSRTAKSASYHHTLASNAASAYQNTLSGYGRHFEDDSAQRLADQHGEAFLDSMAQQFLTTNEAEADQKWLLDQYLDAKAKLNTNSYQYNRLIRDAAGGLGHNGESSIMGQVIIGNSNIENRRRSEARIMINKFGMEKHKQEFRGMIFDIDKINDDGFETNLRGEEIEDHQYRLKKGAVHTPWQRYIGVNKRTGKEITKAEYDALPEAERDKNWTKVRYLDITDDKSNDVQRIFEDDAGYMKELLADDINIADPIVRRFITQIGLSKGIGEKDGILRRYHSTIRTAVDTSKFKNHAPGMTALLTSAANAGLLRTMTDYHTINLQSLSVAMKPGSLQQADKFFIDELTDYVKAASDPTLFKELFHPDEVERLFNNNGVPLKGARITTGADGKPYWETINPNDLNSMSVNEANKCRTDFINHVMMPKAFKSLIAALNRDLTPEAISSLKPGALPALVELTTALSQLGLSNLDENIPYEERLDGGKNIFETPDGHDMRKIIIMTQNRIRDIYGLESNPVKAEGKHNSGTTTTTRVQNLKDQLHRSAEADVRAQEASSLENIFNQLAEYEENALNSLPGGLYILCEDIKSLFSGTLCLNDGITDCQFLIERYSTVILPTDLQEPDHDTEKQLIQELVQAARTLIEQTVHKN